MTGAELAAWIGAGLAALALIAMIGLAIWQRPRKRLAFSAATHFPVINAGPVAPKIDIFADGTRLEDPHMLVVAFRNSGNAAIRPHDYEGPIQIVVNEAKVIDFTVSPARPEIDLTCSVNTEGLAIEPLLLNPGEGAVITAILEGSPHELSLRARIADCHVKDEREDTFAQAIMRALPELVLASAPMPIVRLATVWRAVNPQDRTPTRRS